MQVFDLLKLSTLCKEVPGWDEGTLLGGWCEMFYGLYYFPQNSKAYVKFWSFYLQENEQMWLTTLVALSWPCFILSSVIFSSFVGDIERLTAADTSSLDSSGLMFCSQQIRTFLLSLYCRTSARRSGFMISTLVSEQSGFEPWSGTACCVLGQNTWLSHCLSPPRAELFESRLSLTQD